MFFTLKMLQLMKQDFDLWCSTYIKDSSKSYEEGGTVFSVKNQHGLICSSAKEFYATRFLTVTAQLAYLTMKHIKERL